MRFHDYKNMDDLIQKIKKIHVRTIHYEGDTYNATCDLTNTLTSVRNMSKDYHSSTSGKKSSKRLVAVVVSAGVANDYDHLAKEMKLLISDGFEFISIGKGIKR